jgi:hypothetical protein
LKKYGQFYEFHIFATLPKLQKKRVLQDMKDAKITSMLGKTEKITFPLLAV